MQVESWPIERVIPYARNARKCPQSAIDKVAKSLQAFGWNQPIVVDSKGVIVVGHTRHKAAQKLGYTHVPVVIASHLTASQIKAYRIADNRTHEETDWDLDALRDEAAELTLGEIKLTGFDFGELFPGEEAEAAEKRARKDHDNAASGADKDLVFRVVVDCTGEGHQAEMLDRFKAEGLKCRALIS